MFRSITKLLTPVAYAAYAVLMVVAILQGGEFPANDEIPQKRKNKRGDKRKNLGAD